MLGRFVVVALPVFGVLVAACGGNRGASRSTGTSASGAGPTAEGDAGAATGGAADPGVGGAGGSAGLPTAEAGSAGLGGAADPGVGGAGGGAGLPAAEAGSAGDAGGGAGGVGQVPLQFVVEPWMTANENDTAPLAATVGFETNLPCTGSVQVSGGDETWTLLLDSAAVSHQRIILGVKPDTSYQFRVTVTNEDDELVAAPLEWHTPALPADFPRLEFIQSDPPRMEPGMTLFDVRSQHYIIVVDGTGQVRWYYRSNRTCETVRLLTNGNLIYVSQMDRICEIDWLGNQVAWWFAAGSSASPASAIAVDVAALHHTVHEMPSGNILTLSRELRSIEDYPSSVTDPNAATRTATVLGDVIVEFDREGQIVKAIPLLDLLDPTRVGYGAVTNTGSQDWSHSNSAVYDPDSDAYLVSVRHQDAVVKVDRATESLVWILGDHANWGAAWQDKLLAPAGAELQWPYHQHSAELAPGGGVGMYDNHNNGAPAFEPRQTSFSRAVRYVIDEDQMTVTQAWSHGAASGVEPLFADRVSDADWQPTTGNVLITSGALDTGGDSPYWAHIAEVTTDGTTVFELTVLDSPSIATTYSADRLPDLRYLQDTDHDGG